MSVLVARVLSLRQELAIELQRFWLLWRYQHRVPPFTLWWRLVLKRIVDFVGSTMGLRRMETPPPSFLVFLSATVTTISGARSFPLFGSLRLGNVLR